MGYDDQTCKDNAFLFCRSTPTIIERTIYFVHSYMYYLVMISRIQLKKYVDSTAMFTSEYAL